MSDVLIAFLIGFIAGGAGMLFVVQFFHRCGGGKDA